MLNKYGEKLLSYRYTRNELLRFIDDENGAFRIQALYSRHLELRSFNLTGIQIQQTVLQELRDKNSAVYQDEMEQYQKEIDNIIQCESDNIAKASPFIFFTQVEEELEPVSEYPGFPISFLF